MNREDSLCWFHGKLSREDAENIIKSEGDEDGTFLIRESSSAVGDFVLTLLHQGEVCHYQVRRHGEDAFFSIDDKVKILHGLDTLVEFYQQSANGLTTKLTKHIRKDHPPNDTRYNGNTNLLHRAVMNNNHMVVSELLKCGYRNVDAKNQEGQTAMHLAALNSDEDMLKLLLDAGVSVSCMDSGNNMPLHYACRHQSAAFIRALISAGANIQGRNIRNGYVALHEAAKNGNLDVVKELLSANAPLLPRTSLGEFPIDLAKENNHEEVVLFLENYKLPPANTFKSHWYHGTLTREEAVNSLNEFADNMLQNNTQNESKISTSGCFLIRFSERKTTGAGGYVLTLLYDNVAKNFIISQSSKYLFIDDGPFLPSLEHLVEHFMRFADGLPVNLKYPVLPKPKPPLPLFSTMPRTQNQKNATVQLQSPLGDKTAVRQHLDHQQERELSKKKEHTTTSVFNSLRAIKSPKKGTSILESMATLRKNKLKKTCDYKTKTVLSNDDELKKAETVLKNISFSSDFSTLKASTEEDTDIQPITDDFYNVPRNNSAIRLDLEVEATNSKTIPVSPVALENKTDEEVEYFTKSDVLIERERIRKYNESSTLTCDNGYIPTVDIRVFMEAGASSLGCAHNKDALEASAAELREFSHHPERLDSLISTTSTDSEMLRYLNRQSSVTSTDTVTSETANVIVNPKPAYIIPRESLVIESIIGDGEFGSVYRGFIITNNSATGGELRQEVAIKTLRDEHCRTNKQEFLREASVMIRLKHHCIVQLIGISKGETLMMVQELVSFGSMLHFILENKEKINPKYELKLWASQIACGMQYLEQHHFVHRDLAARNILLASRNQAKISDFGLSRALGTDSDCYQASQGGKWPIKWYAPESFNNGIFSHASDVWSFGVTLWEMWSLGEPPYGDMRGVDAIELIESGKRLAKPALCPDNIFEIMENCWNYKARGRPTFRYLTDFFSRDPDYQNIVELIKTEHIS